MALLSASSTPSSSSSFPRVVIVPGNGCTPVRACNWYGWLSDELLQRGFHDVVLRDMPDPHVARRSRWLPFLKPFCDEDTILVGHSSGAQAGLRLCEETKIRGLVLVSACVTDLGDSNERRSGYYPSRDDPSENPWRYDDVVANTAWVSQFASRGDPFLPFAEQMTVAEGVKAELYEMPAHRGHFMESTFPELADEICRRAAMPAAAPPTGVAVGEEEAVGGGAPPANNSDNNNNNLTKEGVYEWLLDFQDIAPVLRAHLLPAESSGDGEEENEGGTSLPACVVGCGTSTVGQQLWGGGMASEVWSVDNDAGVVQHMQTLHQKEEEQQQQQQQQQVPRRQPLRWLTADLSEDCSEVLPAATFGAVIDKGTFDAMICESGPGAANDEKGGLGGGGETADDEGRGPLGGGGSAGSSAALMSNVARMLSVAGRGGAYVLVSLHPPRLVARLLAAPALDLRIVEATVLGSERGNDQAAGSAPSFVGNDGAGRVDPDELPDRLSPGQFSVIVARKGAFPTPAEPPLSSPPASSIASWESLHRSVIANHQSTLDEWFQDVDPLLTPERRSELENAWAKRLQTSVVEKEATGTLSLADAYEVMFSHQERMEFTMGYFLDDVEVFRDEGLMANPERLTLHEAIEFLRKNQ